VFALLAQVTGFGGT